MKFGVSALVFGLASTAFSADIKKDGHVDVLGKDSFKGWIEEHPIGLVKFYAPWCGHCKTLAPEYEKAAEILIKENIVLGKVDCTEEKELCSEHKVEGFPTVKLFRDGKFFDYRGTRKTDGIVQYMQKQASPAVTVMKHEELEAFKKGKDIVMVAFVEPESEEFKVVKAIADQNRDDYFFVVISDKKAAKKHKASYPGVTLMRNFDEPELQFDGKFTDEALNKFLSKGSVPILGEINELTYKTYSARALPFAYFFYQGDEMRKEMIDIGYDVAKKHNDKISFVLVDADKFARQATNVNLKTEWPAFAIQGFENNGKYPFSQEKKMTKKSIRKFVEQYLEGKIEAVLKSEEIPAKNDSPVLQVVANTFKDLVWTGEKTVLIEMYADWCGHCKKLVPVYDRLATALKGNDDLVIAKMNADLNDIPPEATGMTLKSYPTIFLVHKDTKEVIQYEGDRSFEDMVGFLKSKVRKDLTVADPGDGETKEQPKAEPKAEAPKAGEPKAEKEAREEL